MLVGDVLLGPGKLGFEKGLPRRVDASGAVLLPPHDAHVGAHRDQESQQPVGPLGLEPDHEVLVDPALGDLALVNLLEAVAIHVGCPLCG